ncbi:MAG: DsrE family protein [Thaumarchaeota archaeon]|nr:DsrE family protein [Nitrososphaerota archaeon]MCL5317384.1 DsrE family protein [Nitrososphaerota archaeon]
MKIGIILNTNDPETVWNTFRFGVTSLTNNHRVKVFLLGRGVEAEEISSDQFDVRMQMMRFLDAGGEILACGTCLKIRKKKESEVKMCSISTMQSLLEIVELSDKIITFS